MVKNKQCQLHGYTINVKTSLYATYNSDMTHRKQKKTRELDGQRASIRDSYATIS